MTLFRTYKYLAHSPSLLLNRLRKIKISKPNSVLLFTLSSNAPDLENAITCLSSSAMESIGCLSAPLPHSPEHAVCSIAYLNIKDCVPFRSSIPGKRPIQVGRWLTGSALRNSSASPNYDVNHLPDFSQDASLWNSTENAPLLPERLAELEGARRVSDLGSVIYFSDDSPEGLVRALSRLMNVNQLGLVASHTPFVTGAPFTLFYNGKEFSSGAVGVVLKDTLGLNVKSINYPRLLPFYRPMRIQRVDGNLIHVLDDVNPTEILLEAITAIPTLQVGKNDSLYLGQLLSSSQPSVGKIYRIVAGGQSRGTLALEEDASLKAGDSVQFYVLTTQSTNAKSPVRGSVNFISTGKEDVSLDLNENLPSGIEVVDNFTTASENGFLVSGANDVAPFRCTVPGSVAHAVLKANAA